MRFFWAHAAKRVPVSLEHVVFSCEGPALVQGYVTATDLADGMWLLPRIDNPYDDFRDQGEQQLDALAQQIRGATDPGVVALALGKDFGFGGDRVDYHHPANSFLPHVMSQRAGLPITVAALWYLVCQRLGLEARLLAIPGHVFGAYRLTEDGETKDHFVDLFDHGAAVSRDHLDQMCQIAGHQDATGFLAGAGFASYTNAWR